MTLFAIWLKNMELESRIKIKGSDLFEKIGSFYFTLKNTPEPNIKKNRDW
jgi:hypothetical protein